MLAEFLGQLRFHRRRRSNLTQTTIGGSTMLAQHAPLARRFVGHLPAAVTGADVEPSETQLIEASRRGDATAYGALVRRYENRICSSLMQICRSRADAQDAAQEAFLRAYLKLGSYTGASAFYTWLYRIAVNVAISEHRRRKTRVQTELSRSVRDEASGDAMPEPSAELLRKERVALVQEALGRLSEEHRTILVLREMEQLDYENIAVILEIPVGTVRSRLHRARIELRGELSETVEMQ
jgi:RNA polymerase sigma-70 factor (ECF subfamily)